MIDYVYPIYILSQSRDVYFKEFTCNHNKKLLKTLLTEDINSFNNIVDDIITSLCVCSIEIKDLTVLDKFYIMSAIRYNNVGQTLEMNIKLDDNEFFKHNVNLYDVLKFLEDTNIEVSKELVIDKTTITVALPKHFYDTKDIYDIVINSVQNIKFGNKDIDMTQYNFEEKGNILNKLPGEIVPYVFNFIQKQEEKVSNKPIIDIKSDVDLPFDKTIYLSLINNSLYETIKLFFNFNLRDVYSIEYTLIKKFNFSYDHLSNMTPAEIQVYFNVIAEDLEKEKEEREKQEQSDQFNVPPPNNMPH